MSKSFKVITLGCKVNQCESAFIEESLVKLGCRRVNQGREVELVIINTCIVTARASYQSRQAIRRARREHPRAVIAAIGCYGQVFPDELFQITGVDLITGNRGKAPFPEVVLATDHQKQPFILREEFGVSCSFEPMPTKRFFDRTRAFLKIQDGCDSFCSYCIVPMARGPVRSLEPARVIGALEGLAQSGYKEVVLVGIHLGKYGSDLVNGVTLVQLLVQIDKNRLPLRIRLSSLDPTEITPELIELMASREWLCRHIHISLQSGDDTVLRRMNRHYTARMFAEVVNEIRRRVPQVSLGVDVLVGFPGESEGAFNNTFELLQGLPVSYLHVFPYSKREGTAAAELNDPIDGNRTKERALRLRCLDTAKRRDFRSSLLGETFDVLTEGWAPGGKKLVKGLSDNYVVFEFPTKSRAKNSIVKVRAVKLREKGIAGEFLVHG